MESRTTSRASNTNPRSPDLNEQCESLLEPSKVHESKNGTGQSSGGFITQQEKEDVFSKTARVVEVYSNELVDGWNKEIDTLLVYVGVYSVILTAFNVQSYQYLQPPGPDPTLAALLQLSLQLNSLTITPSYINSTYSASTSAVSDQTGPPADPWAVALNTLWFSALILSLASASVSIMVKQWLREYQNGCSGISLEFARLRQYRLNNLKKWKVAEIVTALPILLQLSLSLFFAGLLVLLWHFHFLVATIASILVAAVMLFVYGLTFLPLFRKDCPYHSPLTLAFLHVMEGAIRSIGSLPPLLAFRFAHLLVTLRLLEEGLHVRFDDWEGRVGTLFNKLKFSTWRDHEHATIRASSSTLDIDMIVASYIATMDLNLVVDAATTMLIDYHVDEVDRCFTRIQAVIYVDDLTQISATLLDRCYKIALDLDLNLFLPSMSGRQFGDISATQQQAILFLLWAAVIAGGTVRTPFGDESSFALLCLGKIIRSNTEACQSITWDIMRNVAGAMTKVVRWYLQGLDSLVVDQPFTMDLALFKEAFGLVRFFLSPSFWSTSDNSGEVQEFLPLAHQLGEHLQQSLLILHTRDDSESLEVTMTVIKYLGEILEFLSLYEDGHTLIAGGLLEAVTETVVHVEAYAQHEDARLWWSTEPGMEQLDVLRAAIGRFTIHGTAGETEPSTHRILESGLSGEESVQGSTTAQGIFIPAARG